MTDQQAAAYVFAQAVAAHAEIQGMVAENLERSSNDGGIVHDHASFLAVIERYGCHHNAIITLYGEAID